jgi:hypothetical protein
VLKKAYEIVKDVLSRETDGRLPAAEPLDAFEHLLEKLGHGRFRSWWSRQTSELRTMNQAHQVTAICVTAASLAEGALAFVAPHGRTVGIFGRLDMSAPKSWGFADLVKGACSGPNEVWILDTALRDQGVRLNVLRQRIHAGFLLGEYATGIAIPDIKPEQAREAVQTCEAIVRRIVEWLEKHPPVAAS